jgi:hypothetical protein
MWDKQPGDRVTLEIRRKRWFSGVKEMDFDLELQ